MHTKPMDEARATDIRALSCTQPWPWIIRHLDKRIENRSRSLGHYVGTFLLHASKAMPDQQWEAAYRFVRDRVGYEAAQRIPKPYVLPNGEMRTRRPRGTFGFNPELPRGVIVGVLHSKRLIQPEEAQAYVREQARVGLVQAREAPWPLDQERWYMGAYGYVLSRRQAWLSVPIPHQGALGFWRPSQHALVAALAAAGLSTENVR